MSQTDEFHEATLLIADAIGEVIEHWGFRKALGRIWTVLYLAGEPLPAPDIADRLSMSAGATSMALNELQEWAVVNRSWRPGERREFFVAEIEYVLSPQHAQFRQLHADLHHCVKRNCEVG